jgi:hypothetical protein
LARRSAPLAAVLAAGALAWGGCGGSDEASKSDQARAVNEAKQAYAKLEAQQQDLTRGPCIAERLPGLPDWVVDIAHDPRQAVDDQAANQCARFRSGEAHHFVELDPTGELIRAQ